MGMHLEFPSFQGKGVDQASQKYLLINSTLLGKKPEGMLP